MPSSRSRPPAYDAVSPDLSASDHAPKPSQSRKKTKQAKDSTHSSDEEEMIGLTTSGSASKASLSPAVVSPSSRLKKVQKTGARAKKDPPPPTSLVSRNSWIYIVVIGVLIIAAVVAAVAVLAKRGDHGDEHEADDKPSNTTLPNLELPSFSPVVSRFPELQSLFTGNRAWRAEIEHEKPGLVSSLAEGQHPVFSYLGCSDSRVPETPLFNLFPGDLFVERSIGNTYNMDDLNAEAWLSYGVGHVGVKHIIVMGHYGCGAVQAAIASPAGESADEIGANRIEAFIRPIRSLFARLDRPEIVAFRQQYQNGAKVPAPNRTEPAFKALVEENVKAALATLANDPSVQTVWRAFAQSRSSPRAQSPPQTDHDKRSAGTSASAGKSESKAGSQELWLHGFVYDIDLGLFNDLGISRGPPGM